MGLKLEEGKCYQSRDGRDIVKVGLLDKPDGEWTFKVVQCLKGCGGDSGIGVGIRYTNEGKYLRSSTESNEDLVKEIVEEAIEESAESLNPPLKLEVGKKYRSRNGDITEIISAVADYGYDFTGVHLDGVLQGDEESYMEDGHFLKYTEDYLDLIEEVVEEAAEGVLQLKLGKRYRDKMGNIVEITASLLEDDNYDYLGVCVAGPAHGELNTYTQDGYFFLDRREASHNLVEEFGKGLPEPVPLAEVEEIVEKVVPDIAPVSTISHEGMLKRFDVDPTGIGQHEPGAKMDGGKILAGILADFPRALLAIAEVATYGANKYTRGGWQHVPNGPVRYTDAMWRHFLNEGISDKDEESGLLHAAHGAWNALARLELELRKLEQDE